MNKSIHVCVIGAGVSGLPAIKSCLENDLLVTCYEKSSDIGGLWNYRPNQLESDCGTVMKSTIVNTSKEIMAYSDFPPPAYYPNFMHNSFVQEYLRDYGETFGLLKYIKFGVGVVSLSINEEENGKYWKVELTNGQVDFFDSVMLCTGHHSIPKYPKDMVGLDSFEGKVIHAKEYKDYKGFENKDVFIVGIGNSALDIGVELGKIAKSVTISTRRGSWVFNRCSQGGMPYDILLMSRLYQKIMATIPWTVANDFMEHRLQQRMDHDMFGLRPDHRFFQQHPTVNDALANHLLSGMITVTEDVAEILPTQVKVKNGTKFNADIIIMATGYTFAFPYLQPQSLIPINDHVIDLYKHIFPPHQPNIAVIGLVQPIGALQPISELQSRVAAQLFSGKLKLPPKQQQISEIEENRKLMRKRYFDSNKHTLQVDMIPYLDSLAEMISCVPPVSTYLWKDFKFWMQLYVGANVPYVYRLVGPNSWKGARKAIEEVPERVKFPIKNRECRTRKHKKRGHLNEYFRYVSMKWIAGYTCLIVVSGVWTFCFGPTGMPIASYLLCVFMFLVLFSFMLLWFDMQYDMTTIF
uniref:Flavin-containing monooxygenase n=1 Tax=Rhabditophanes sp. KR3021 TaxID=114890 RepID=A0AC35UFT1_9BILA